jgi:hypothetical protein
MQEEVGARFCDRLIEVGQVVPIDGKSVRSAL